MARPVAFTGVAAQLKARIDAGSFAPGNPLPPEAKLAAQFGVNRLTLRKAVSLLASEGVLLRRAGSGTFVQASARHGAQAGSVLYVGATSEHFYQNFHEALCAHAHRSGKGVTAFTPTGTDGALLQLSQLSRSHRRMICTTGHWDKINGAVPSDVRVTLVTGAESLARMPGGNRPMFVVSTDTYRAAKLAVEHLARLGHRRVGYLDAGYAQGDDPLVGAIPADREPYLGFRSGVQECKLTAVCALGIPHILLTGDAIDVQLVHERYFRHNLDQLEALPDAFVCMGDFRVAALLRVLRERGVRVPQDMSLVGIGNTPWADMLDPPLTSVCLGETEMARMALLLNDEPDPVRTRVFRVDPELVERGSTAARAR